MNKLSEGLAKNNLSMGTLKEIIPPLEDDKRRNVSKKMLQGILRVSLSNLSVVEYEINQQNQESRFQDLATLSHLNFKANLQTVRVQLKIQKSKPETFYHAFEMLSDISHMEALKTSMDSSKVDKKGKNMKKIIAEFLNIEYLDLQLTFETDVQENNKNLTSLASFKSLQYLNLDVFAKSSYSTILIIHHSNAIKFAVAQKNLETFKFKACHMRFDEYVERFQGVQKKKSLSKLCVIQLERYLPMSFGHGIVFKTLEILKKLKKFHLGLDYYGCDGDEMSAVLRHLLKYPSLKNLRISLKIDPRPNKPYKFDDEFYESV